MSDTASDSSILDNQIIPVDVIEYLSSISGWDYMIRRECQGSDI